MQPKELEKLNDMNRLTDLFYWQKPAMCRLCFPMNICNISFFPKEEKDEKALLSVVVYYSYGQWENQIIFGCSLRS